MAKTPRVVSANPSPQLIKGKEFVKTDVSTSIHYLNNLGADVIILDRKGLEYHIPGKGIKSSNLSFIIEESIDINEDTILNFNEQESDEDIVKYREAILDSMVENNTGVRRNNKRVLLHSEITLGQLKANEGGVYLKEYDIVVYLAGRAAKYIHPATITRVLNNISVGISSRIDGFSFSVIINDPKNTIGSRFINICGIVHEIVPNRDPTSIPGVVVSTATEATNGEYTHVTMSLEDFDQKIKTYRSMEEAETLGNLDEQEKARLNKELQDLKHSNEIELEKLKGAGINAKSEMEKLKAENQEFEAKHKQQEQEYKARIERMELLREEEKHEREMESLRMKSYYEERSHDRKDSSEVIKFLPLILGAGLALLFKG